jgi:hypothetical protein
MLIQGNSGRLCFIANRRMKTRIVGELKTRFVGELKARFVGKSDAGFVGRGNVSAFYPLQTYQHSGTVGKRSPHLQIKWQNLCKFRFANMAQCCTVFCRHGLSPTFIIFGQVQRKCKYMQNINLGII